MKDVLVSLLYLIAIVALIDAQDGYYWKDYVGVIPIDAVPGGKDQNEDITFIGQAVHPGGRLTPGVIKTGSRKVFYEFGNEVHEAEEDVKILCSQHPKQMVWLHVYVQNSIFNINGTQLIIAGHDASGPLVIGRRNTGSEVVVGRVPINGTKFAGFWFATGGASKYDLAFDDFDILVFNSFGDVRGDCGQKTITAIIY